MSESVVSQRFAIVDTETTGLFPANDRVLQLGVVIVRGDGTIERQFATHIKRLVFKPGRLGAHHVHGITRSDLLRGMPLEVALGELQDMMQGAIFTAHNAAFDLGFLRAEATRASFALNISSHLCTAAVESGEQLHITYFSPARAQRSERTITPRKVFEDGGHWYVAADDDDSGEQRVFRIDRIEALEHTSKFAPRLTAHSSGNPGDESEWFSDSLQQVTLRVQPRARWVVESYPYISRTINIDGSVDITMAVSSEHWLGRLLLRAGTNVSVLEPVELRDVGTRTASAVLKRYG